MLRACLLSCLLSCVPPGGAGAARSSGLVAQAVPPSQQASVVWYQISPRGESFTFRMPVVPKLHEDKADDGVPSFFRIGGAEIRRQTTYHAYYDGAVYLVQVYKTSSPNELLKDLIDRPPFKGAPAHDSEANGFTIKEYVESGDHFYRKTRFIKSGKFLYELDAAARSADNSTLDQFLSSFAVGQPDHASAEVVSPVGEAPARTTPAAKSVGAAGADAGPVFGPKEIALKAVILYKPEPLYTDAARENQITGSIELKFVLSSDGEVGDIKVVSGLKLGLNESAIKAARAIRFLPAEKDGRKVSQYVTIVYNFDIY